MSCDFPDCSTVLIFQRSLSPPYYRQLSSVKSCPFEIDYAFGPCPPGINYSVSPCLRLVIRSKRQIKTQETYHSNVVTIQKCLTHLSLRNTTCRDLAIRQSKYMTGR
jgi:hypothetical protein